MVGLSLPLAMWIVLMNIVGLTEIYCRRITDQQEVRIYMEKTTKDTKKIHTKNSLGWKMLALVVLPVLLLGTILMGVGMHAFSGSMEKHVQKEMTEQTQLILRMLDQEYPGEFSLRKDTEGNYRIYKGGQDITRDTEFIDDMKEIMGVEVTLFCQDVRLLTTLKDAKGNSFVNTAVSSVIAKDVLKQKKAHFYTSTTNVGTERNFAYYQPIFLKDGTCFGMVGVCRRAADVEKNIREAVFPLLLVCIAAMFVIGGIGVWYAQKLAGRIHVLQRFMKKLTQEEFETEIPGSLLKVNDELGDLARSGKTMQESIRRQVELDELTQLYNRRYGDKRLLRMRQEMQKSGVPYCVAIGDIDLFKKVNDEYGHEAGDVVLTRVARILKELMLCEGYVCRWGGEEFLLVMEDCTLERAGELLQNILDTLRTQEIEYLDRTIRVTMSVGLVQAEPSEEIDDILRRADRRLYYAKSHGRDQVRL